MHLISLYRQCLTTVPQLFDRDLPHDNWLRGERTAGLATLYHTSVQQHKTSSEQFLQCDTNVHSPLKKLHELDAFLTSKFHRKANASSGTTHHGSSHSRASQRGEAPPATRAQFPLCLPPRSGPTRHAPLRGGAGRGYGSSLRQARPCRGTAMKSWRVSWPCTGLLSALPASRRATGRACAVSCAERWVRDGAGKSALAGVKQRRSEESPLPRVFSGWPPFDKKRKRKWVVSGTAFVDRHGSELFRMWCVCRQPQRWGKVAWICWSRGTGSWGGKGRTRNQLCGKVRALRGVWRSQPTGGNKGEVSSLSWGGVSSMKPEGVGRGREWAGVVG